MFIMFVETKKQTVMTLYDRLPEIYREELSRLHTIMPLSVDFVLDGLKNNRYIRELSVGQMSDLCLFLDIDNDYTTVFNLFEQ